MVGSVAPRVDRARGPKGPVEQCAPSHGNAEMRCPGPEHQPQQGSLGWCQRAWHHTLSLLCPTRQEAKQAPRVRRPRHVARVGARLRRSPGALALQLGFPPGAQGPTGSLRGLDVEPWKPPCQGSRSCESLGTPTTHRLRVHLRTCSSQQAPPLQLGALAQPLLHSMRCLPSQTQSHGCPSEG